MKILFNKNSRCFALVTMLEIWSLKFNLELKITPKSSTSFVCDRFTPASSKTLSLRWLP